MQLYSVPWMMEGDILGFRRVMFVSSSAKFPGQSQLVSLR